MYDESWAGLGYWSCIYITSSNLVAGQVKPVHVQVSYVWNTACSIGELLAVLTGRDEHERTVGCSISYAVLPDIYIIRTLSDEPALYSTAKHRHIVL